LPKYVLDSLTPDQVARHPGGASARPRRAVSGSILRFQLQPAAARQRLSLLLIVKGVRTRRRRAFDREIPADGSGSPHGGYHAGGCRKLILAALVVQSF